ncbi:MAG: AzlD domain-containing protein [Pseudomonadota bacterium]
MMETSTIWTVIILLGLGSFAMRFLFLGIVGDKELPDWLLRHLRYTAVAIIPGLVAPLVVWPGATGGELDPPRLTAALATLVVGWLTNNVIAAIAGGATTLYTMLFFFG